MNKYLLPITLLLLHNSLRAQLLMPGFDAMEYRQAMLISARSTAEENYFKEFPQPDYRMIYQSKPLGLDNSWDLWRDDRNVAVVSLRGTTAKSESWLENIYAAMVPAKGSLRLSSSEIFEYHLADNQQAAVHVGWLLGTAFLSKEILPKLAQEYASGVRDVIVVGHSQGGAIAYLLTAYLRGLQSQGIFPADVQLKTYCSAAPKPGNLFFAYSFEAQTQGGWAYNVVNAADWVPQVPISIQTLDDFSISNPFKNVKSMLAKQKWPARAVLKHIYNQLDKPTRKSQANYQRYLGKMTSKLIKQHIPEFEPPTYVNSSHYVRTGTMVVLYPDADYYSKFPDSNTELFPHHFHQPYLYLLEKLSQTPP